MSFITNESQQLSLFDSLGFLSERKQKILERSWAKPFSDYIFSNIDEMIFAPLYSEKRNSRPNAPINVIVGALILKEFNGLSDDDILEECECDFRYQYALHTTSFEDQPISDRTFSRFRERNAAYELTTGIDLIHTCMTGLAEKIREFMDINPSIKRMDSMMIESNIRRMGRLELLYTCLSNLIITLKRDGYPEMPKGLETYADPNNRNRVVYYEKNISQSERLQKVIDDAAKILPLCRTEYEYLDDYQLLLRALNEQTKENGTGKRIPKDKEDDMDSTVLQNPSDPDATFRVKNNKQHRGYVANLTETVDSKGSIITDYQYDINTRSDSSFIKEYIEKAPESEEIVTVITDGAYGSEENRVLASEKNIQLLTTGLIGRKPRKILSEFQLSDDGKAITVCPEGNTPKSNFYIRQTDSIRISFHCEQCINCPRKSECNPDIRKRTAVMIISLRSRKRLIDQNLDMDDETRTFIGRIRNGIETVPSIIRNKYGVDRIPVRGKLKTKQFFGFKVGALNFTKLLRFVDGKEKCRAFQPL